MDGIVSLVIPSPQPSPFQIQLVSDGSPWWADIVQTLAVLLAGAAITFFTTWFFNRRKSIEDDRRRWQEEIRPAVDTMLQLSVSLSVNANVLAALEIRNSFWSRARERRLRGNVSSLHTKMNTPFSLLFTIAPEETWQAARKVISLASYIQVSFGEERAELSRELFEAATAFAVYARRYLTMKNEQVEDYVEKFEAVPNSEIGDESIRFRRIREDEQGISK